MTEQINLLAFVCTNQYAFLIKQGGKFKMKKRISLIMALTLITSMFSAMSASAAISGKKGYYSAVDSVINNHPIQSFTIDNKTVVTTTDLKDYGFSVIWDGAARAVYITRALAYGSDIIDANLGPVRNFQPYVGEVAFTTVPSDIRVFIQGTEVPCYVTKENRTYVRFSDLTLASVPFVAEIGHVWNAETLRSEININDLNNITGRRTGLPHYAADDATAPNSVLTYEQACEIMNRELANSVYAKYATIIDEYTVALAEGRAVNGVLGGDYVFSLYFNFAGNDVTYPVTVNQNGTVNFAAIPAWVTFFCTNN
jgi:hypothetical protein